MDDDPRTPSGDDGLARRRARDAELVADDDIWTDDEPAAAERTDDAEVVDAPRAPRGPKSPLRNAIEWVAVVVGAVVIAVVVRTFVFQTFWIPTPSMAPTLVEDDRVLVNKLSYRFHDPRRGDVIVFEKPENETLGTTKDLIKRVIALPGERISILDGQVLIDGEVLDEPYVDGQPTTYEPCGTGDVAGIDTEQGLLIPDDHVLVMGDNRANSQDGRCFGPISEDLIVGRAFFIIWPPSHAGGL